MINVSNEFKKTMNFRTDFKENAEITFADGTVLNLTEKDFTISNNSVTDAADTNGIPLGIALCRSIQIELINDNEQFSNYDFFGAIIRLYLTFQLSATTERIEYGTFTVLTPETCGETVIITALDDMYKADKDYSTPLVFPTTMKALLVDACNALGIPLGSTSFLNDDFVVETVPEGITYRQLFGYIAMIAGGNARIDVVGKLRILSYDFEKIQNLTHIIDGGAYSPWNNNLNLDGGSFSPWNNGDSVDGGTFLDRNEFHMLSAWNNLKIDTDDVVITGITTTYTDDENQEHTVNYGAEGYMLRIDNPLIAGKEQIAVELIGNIMVGGKFRQFSGDLVSNPTVEFMDIAMVIDRKGNMYTSFITDINFQFFGFTTVKNSAEPTLRNSSKPYSDATKTLVAARKLINNERNAREQAVAQLAKELKNSSGLFMTQEKQEDGSTIYYMHDKPTLQESLIVWKLTALAFGISTDGGKTYPYGFSVDGTTITRLLYAEGIDADYIDTGAIRITDTAGNTMFLADYNTKQVYVNASNVKIGSRPLTDELVGLSAAISVNASEINLKVSKGNVSSQLSVENDTISIKSNRFSWESTYSSLTHDGKLKAKDVDLSGRITAYSGKIGGFYIGDSYIYSGSKNIIDSKNKGIYIGEDGISIGPQGAKPTFKITSDGNVYIDALDNSSIKIARVGSVMELTPDGIDFSGGGLLTSISKTKVQVNDNYIDAYKLHCGSSSLYTEIQDDDITIKSASGVLKINGLSTTFASGNVTYSYKDNLEDNLCLFSTGTVSIIPSKLNIGKSDGILGFFGSANRSKKQTVSIISVPSSANESTIATKVNELINALKAYNLIG